MVRVDGGGVGLREVFFSEITDSWTEVFMFTSIELLKFSSISTELTIWCSAQIGNRKRGFKNLFILQTQNFRVLHLNFYLKNFNLKNNLIISNYFIIYPKITLFTMCSFFKTNVLQEEQGKAGGHEPPLFPLPGHILAFFSSGSHEPPLYPLPYHHI